MKANLRMMLHSPETVLILDVSNAEYIPITWCPASVSY